MFKKSVVLPLVCLLFISCKNNNFENISSMTQTILDNPKSVEAYNIRGIAFAQDSDYNSALKDFSQAIQLDSNFIDAYINRGTLFLNKGYLDKAAADYNHVLTLQPNNAIAYIGLGNIALAEENFKEALYFFNKATGLTKNYRAFYGKAIVLQKLNRHKESIDAFFAALSNNPKLPQMYVDRGLSYLAINDLEKAKKDFSIALNIDNNFAIAWYRLGDIYERDGCYVDALEAYKAAKQLDDKIEDIDKHIERLNALCSNFNFKCNKVADKYFKHKIYF
ncbi:tetratricopeptide repeat protein [Bartonella sp. DGB1]|uniref:tetratricopeptide repeat protein n=1 Tax=Bartonella sp. DGB1 TaxID=3239807 RepID=UPI003524E903